MLEIFCAIYPEAKPLIETFHLKKERNTVFDQFSNEDHTIRCTLTGVGKENASAAVTMTLMHSSHPFVLSYGCSAYLDQEATGLFQACSICDIDTGIAYYPDLLIATDCKECGFFTGSQLLQDDINPRSTLPVPFDLKVYLESMHYKYPSYYLYDMESSAVYQSANRFVGPHEMMFLRYTTDQDARSIHADEVYRRSKENIPVLEQIIQKIFVFHEEEKKEMDTVVQQFKDKIHASTTQVNQIDQIVMYCMSAGIDYVSILHELLKQDIQEKEDGKRVLNAFQRRCCGE
ncbi:hypothetical protein CGK76_01115 [Erysipelotrichaceae bacterium 7770_A6]|nr:hypothetical protein [Erysipelotrichaceae bacterium 7770_A6]